MPNDLPDFVPRDIPKSAILDLSHTLSNNSMDSLTQVAGTVAYSPKVLVLPSDYVSRDTAQLTRNIAKQWSVDGDGKTLLVVVDLKGHKVRAHGSPELNRAGVTSEYISDNLIPQQFIPYMKKGDLATAIRLTVLDVNHKQSQSSLPLTQSSSVATVPVQLSAESAPQANSNGIVTIILAIVIIGSCIGAGLSFALFSKRKSSNRKALQDLTITLDSLYRKADQVGQASEYIQPGTDVQISHDIADFFARLETVQKAQAQVEKLSRSGLKIKETEDALRKCCRYAKIMDFTATTLLNQVNEKTGAVSSFEANANIDVSEEPDFASHGSEGVSRQSKVEDQTAQKEHYVIKTNSRYRSPSWITDSRFSRRSDDDDDGLLAVSSYLNTVDRDIYPPIRWQNATITNYGDSNRTSKSKFSNSLWNNTTSDGGGSWSGSSKSSGKSSSWESSNSSSTESSDGGGSWGSSSSSDNSSSSDSSSSSDGGGSW